MRSRTGLAALAGLLIAGCAGKTPEPKIVLKPYPVATPVGCVVDRPTPPVTLLMRISDEAWSALAPGARARAVEAQAGERMNYQDALATATSGCKDAPAAAPGR